MATVSNVVPARNQGDREPLKGFTEVYDFLDFCAEKGLVDAQGFLNLDIQKNQKSGYLFAPIDGTSAIWFGINLGDEDDIEEAIASGDLQVGLNDRGYFWAFTRPEQEVVKTIRLKVNG